VIPFLSSTLALIVTLGLLIAFHEYGHFWTARKLGVKVLRYSIGFGKPLWMRRRGPDQTEYVLAAIPLGGYVKMLDEREGEVAPEEQHRAFNRQSVWRRFAIVLAGPLFNFIFAILAFWLMYLIGVPGVKPILGEVEPQTVAAVSGFKVGDQIIEVGGEKTPTWGAVRLTLLDYALDSDEVEMKVRAPNGGEHVLKLPVKNITTEEKQKNLLSIVGINPFRPELPAVLGQLEPGGPAETAGLQENDRVLKIGDQQVSSWTILVDLVRAHPQQKILIEIERNGETHVIAVNTKQQKTDAGIIGKIGASPARSEALSNEYLAEVKYPFFDAFGVAVVKTWQMSVLTLRMIGKMIVGEVSLDNLSGPITIATYAGYTASAGISPFLYFLAVISISLGVLNLLPIPLLDGGHLLNYLIEIIKGSPLSDVVQAQMQRVGIFFLVMLMSLALYNDIARLIVG
jgi:regulator of sigma E protease